MSQTVKTLSQGALKRDYGPKKGRHKRLLDILTVKRLTKKGVN